MGAFQWLGETDRTKRRIDGSLIRWYDSWVKEVENGDYYMKEGDTVVELDQFKYTLSTFEKPLVEVRDSLWPG